MDNIRVARTAVSIVDMLIKKNEAYGADNILFTGLDGISVRLIDKAWRIINLAEHPEVDNQFESVQDTYRDIIGYCIIGLAVLDGKWRMRDETFRADLLKYTDSLIILLSNTRGPMPDKYSIGEKVKTLYSISRKRFPVNSVLMQYFIQIGRDALYCLVDNEVYHGADSTGDKDTAGHSAHAD